VLIGLNKANLDAIALMPSPNSTIVIRKRINSIIGLSLVCLSVNHSSYHVQK
jgi:hypothetical protein